MPISWFIDTERDFSRQKTFGPMQQAGRGASLSVGISGGRLRHRRKVGCRHSETLTTVTAGLARTVCETCGHVSVRYIEETVQLYPVVIRRDPLPVQSDGTSRRGRKCALCSQRAMFFTPEGIVCSEHAWQAAAKSSWGGGVDPWVPIPLDTSSLR